MEPNLSWNGVCPGCGRGFSSEPGLSNHQRSCTKGKKRLGNVLGKAQDFWREKRRKVLDLAPDGSSIQQGPPGAPLPATAGTSLLNEVTQRKGKRARRQPKKVRDNQPEPLAALPPPSHQPDNPALSHPTLKQAPGAQPPPSSIRKLLRSTRNVFGLFRQYYAAHFPTHDPDERSTSKPSQASFRRLIDIVGSPSYKPENVSDTDWRRINKDLGRDNPEEEGWEDDDRAGAWVETPITINVPFHKDTANPGQAEFEAGTLFHRPLVSVIRERISNPANHPHLHYEPYKLFWQPRPDVEAVRVHGELYTSDAFIEAHRALQDSPPEPACDLPRVVVGVMFGSDGTQLTAFGDAQLAPVYLGIGNESKDRRAMPSCHAIEHVAYFEKLPTTFKTFAAEHIGGKGPNQAFTAHCQRELYHEQWSTILDDEFIEAYRHGIVIDCCDGVRRRFYPRIFTYSADYPEKVILASIRNLGRCPCPSCLITKDRIDKLGSPQDMQERQTLARVDDARRRSQISSARKIIYEKDYAVNSAAVERILKEESLVPTDNAFSKKLSPFDFNVFDMLVVDLMHEIELGVWKNLFIHLIRILDAVDEGLKYELDRRYREISAFGTNGVRRTTSNRSELKKMTANAYEDALLCAIPAFDGLLPEPHNGRLLKLLFELAHLHGLAKLEMHTDTTLDVLSEVTAKFAHAVKDFQDNTCSQFQTRELERERKARRKREKKKEKEKGKGKGSENENENDNEKEREEDKEKGQEEAGAPDGPGETEPESKGPRKPKEWNTNTYKFHRLGDYVSTIRRMGVTGSYSTQRFELEHKTSKMRYLRTSHRTIPLQLSQIETRERRIRRIRESVNRRPSIPEQPDVADDLQARYSTGKTQNYPIHVPSFLLARAGDPAVEDFSVKLQKHLHPRLLEALKKEADDRPGIWRTALNDAEMAPPEAKDPSSLIYLKNERIYHHKRTYFHFTTYDVKRGSDLINPGTLRHNVMLLDDGDTGHHYMYARVLGMYHANVLYTGPGSLDFETRRMDFLWVRWYEVVDPASSGWDGLDFLSFPPIEGPDAFGFVDPNDVVRGCHIVPDFNTGKRHDDGACLSGSVRDGDDYKRYYICRFSERDLLMRYHWGLGVGHLQAHEKVAISRTAKEQADSAASVPTVGHVVGNVPPAQSEIDLRADDAYDSDEPVLGMDDHGEVDLVDDSSGSDSDDDRDADDGEQDEGDIGDAEMGEKWTEEGGEDDEYFPGA
ncbi:hypothetical protein BV25DRAFT_1815207 [Artomyces pyxidatus]|uniref:Uncharacterized protein n=1 Tax=Artomyces pyxidatus TaxID=48021 RepID=A0ACB8SID0_9AGAM|nr:hypothetical protein BV25DRAFT_1815207 [Artomyces pyxidatus]